jgi:hypothetical protein
VKRDAPGAGDGGGTVGAAAERPAARLGSAFAGLRHPIVVILLAIAFFTSISGKPVDGVLMLIVAVALAWDTGRRAGDAGRGQAAADRPRPLAGSGRWRVLALAGLLAGGAAYAVVVGSFSRYSWPATAGIVGLGTVVVLTGWQGARRQRAASPLPMVGTALWAGLGVAGGLWELGTLLAQPSLTTDSYAHPTLSTLTDPVLASWGGRAAVLAAWLLLGWFLVER